MKPTRRVRSLGHTCQKDQQEQNEVSANDRKLRMLEPRLLELQGRYERHEPLFRDGEEFELPEH